MRAINRIDPRTGERNRLSLWPDSASQQYFELISLIDDLVILIKASRITGEVFIDEIDAKLDQIKALIRQVDYQRQADVEDGIRWPRWIIGFIGESGEYLEFIREKCQQAHNSAKGPTMLYKELIDQALKALAEFDSQAKAGPGPDGELVEYIVIDPVKGFASSIDEEEV